MTGWPVGAHYAFIGYSISLMVKGMTGITNIYGYVWYGHAMLTGAFVAMIPFTRMIHVLTTPVVLMMLKRDHRFNQTNDTEEGLHGHSRIQSAGRSLL